MQRVALAVVVIVILLLALGIVLLSQPSRPAMPRDRVHMGVGDTHVCQGCHHPSRGSSPVTAAHPVEKSCFKCHALAAAADSR